MESGSVFSDNSRKCTRKVMEGGAARGARSHRRNADEHGDRQIIERRRVGPARRVVDLPADVRATVVVRHGEYDARRLRSQRDVIRDVMLAAADCDTWLTLGELHAMTRYGEASISAQLRHLRKPENGGYDIAKRHPEDAAPAHAGARGRGECLWEYRVVLGIHGGQRFTSETGSGVQTTSEV